MPDAIVALTEKQGGITNENQCSWANHFAVNSDFSGLRSSPNRVNVFEFSNECDKPVFDFKYKFE